MKIIVSDSSTTNRYVSLEFQGFPASSMGMMEFLSVCSQITLEDKWCDAGFLRILSVYF